MIAPPKMTASHPHQVSDKTKKKKKDVGNPRKVTESAQKKKKSPKGTSTSIGRISSAPAAEVRNLSVRFDVGRSNRIGAVRIRGCDYLGSDTFPTSGNTVKSTYLIGPRSKIFEETRLAKFGQLYEKYVFRELKFHLQSAAPTSANGSYVLAFDRDMADPTPENTNIGTRQLLSFAGSTMGNLWQSKSITCPLADTQDFYYTNYTDYDGRLCYQGQIYLASVIASSDSSNAYSLWVEYDVELFDPQLERDENSLTVTAINPSFSVPMSSQEAWSRFFGVADMIRAEGNIERWFPIEDGTDYRTLGKIALDPGTYLFNWWFLNSGTTGVNIEQPVVKDKLTGAILSNVVKNFYRSGNASNGTTATAGWVIDVVKSATVTGAISALVSTASLSNSVLRVLRLQSADFL